MCHTILIFCCMRDALSAAKLLRPAALVNKTIESELAVIVFLRRSRDFETLKGAIFKYPVCMCALKVDGSLPVS